MEIQDLEPVLFQVAMLFLLISFARTSYLRSLVILSNICMILLGLYDYYLSLDIIVWSLIQMFVNLFYLSARLFCSRRFDQDYENLYRRVFQSVLNRSQYTRLMKECMVKIDLKEERTDIVKRGDPFTELIILGKVEQDYNHVQLKIEETILIDRLESWSWIGCNEFLHSFIKDKNDNAHVNPVNFGTTLHAFELMKSLTFFKIRKNKLFEFFKDSDVGRDVYKAFMSKILEYSSCHLFEGKICEIQYFVCKSQQAMLADRDPSSTFANKFKQKVDMSFFEPKQSTTLIGPSGHDDVSINFEENHSDFDIIN